MGRLDALLARIAPVKVITDPCLPEAGPLLVRYMLVKTDRVGLYIHHLLRSDHERALHDHPWSFFTWRFGSYIEHTERGAFRRRRFSIGWRPASYKHRLQLERPVWTIVLRLRQRGAWGFWPDGRFVSWQDYGGAGCED